jgi:hypothetical protein
MPPDASGPQMLWVNSDSSILVFPSEIQDIWSRDQSSQLGPVWITNPWILWYNKIVIVLHCLVGRLLYAAMVPTAHIRLPPDSRILPAVSLSSHLWLP